MSQRNYQSNYGPITRFSALSQPINVAPSQPTRQQRGKYENDKAPAREGQIRSYPHDIHKTISEVDPRRPVGTD